MVAARPGFERVMVGTGLATPYMDKLIKHHSHIEEDWFLVRTAGVMTTDNADYCMIVTEWVWSKSRVCLLRLEVDMGSGLESELCIIVFQFASGIVLFSVKKGFEEYPVFKNCFTHFRITC